MKIQAKTINKKENDIHDYDDRINQVYKLLQKDLSLDFSKTVRTNMIFIW